MMEQPPTISQAYRLLLQEQRHKELTQLSNPLPDLMAFVSECNCSYPKHPASSSQKPHERHNVSSIKRPSRYFCDHCKISGHSIEHCFKVHGYPSSTKNGKRLAALVHTNPDDISPSIKHTPSQFNTLVSLLCKHTKSDHDDCAPDSTTLVHNHTLVGISCLISKHDSSAWILNSSATNHMCHSLSSFVHINQLTGQSHFVTIPNGRKVRMDMVGDVQLLDNILLKNVLYVTEFQFNLVSVQRLCATNILLKPLVLGKLFHGLYCTTQQPSTTTSSHSQATLATHGNKTDSSMLWHMRLGHLSLHTLQLLCPDVDTKPLKNHVICTICPQAKQHRLPFSHSSIKFVSPFQYRCMGTIHSTYI